MNVVRALVVASSLVVALHVGCASGPGPAEECSSEHLCATAGYVCSPSQRVCVPIGFRSAPCSVRSDCFALACRKGVCAEPAGKNEPCESSEDCNEALSCSRSPGAAEGRCVGPNGEYQGTCVN